MDSAARPGAGKQPNLFVYPPLAWLLAGAADISHFSARATSRTAPRYGLSVKAEGMRELAGLPRVTSDTARVCDLDLAAERAFYRPVDTHIMEPAKGPLRWINWRNAAPTR